MRFLVITWEAAGHSGRNHYLAGDPPFAARRYAAWIEKSYPGLRRRYLLGP